MPDTVIAAGGSVPKPRSGLSAAALSLVCWVRGGHTYVAWISPPNVSGFRLLRCAFCGDEHAD